LIKNGHAQPSTICTCALDPRPFSARSRSLKRHGSPHPVAGTALRAPTAAAHREFCAREARPSPLVTPAAPEAAPPLLARQRPAWWRCYSVDCNGCCVGAGLVSASRCRGRPRAGRRAHRAAKGAGARGTPPSQKSGAKGRARVAAAARSRTRCTARALDSTDTHLSTARIVGGGLRGHDALAVQRALPVQCSHARLRANELCELVVGAKSAEKKKGEPSGAAAGAAAGSEPSFALTAAHRRPPARSERPGRPPSILRADGRLSGQAPRCRPAAVGRGARARWDASGGVGRPAGARARSRVVGVRARVGAPELGSAPGPARVVSSGHDRSNSSLALNLL
jgi:hypothetical protein